FPCCENHRFGKIDSNNKTAFAHSWRSNQSRIACSTTEVQHELILFHTRPIEQCLVYVRKAAFQPRIPLNPTGCRVAPQLPLSADNFFCFRFFHDYFSINFSTCEAADSASAVGS